MAITLFIAYWKLTECNCKIASLFFACFQLHRKAHTTQRERYKGFSVVTKWRKRRIGRLSFHNPWYCSRRWRLFLVRCARSFYQIKRIGLQIIQLLYCERNAICLSGLSQSGVSLIQNEHDLYPLMMMYKEEPTKPHADSFCTCLVWSRGEMHVLDLPKVIYLSLFFLNAKNVWSVQYRLIYLVCWL
jgi:hypothetical protein